MEASTFQQTKSKAKSTLNFPDARSCGRVGVRFEMGFCKSRLLITHQAFQMGPKHAHRAPQSIFPSHDPVANPTSHTSTRAAVMLPLPSNKSRKKPRSDGIFELSTPAKFHIASVLDTRYQIPSCPF
jgi:hypothetical protein